MCIALLIYYAIGYLKFWHAILIDLGSLLIVVLNGTRLMRYGVFESIADSSKSTPTDAKQRVVHSTTYTAIPQG